MVKNSIEESETDEVFTTDFGDRKVSHINQSRMIAMPKMALKNCCGTADDLTVNVNMVQDSNGEKFLKLKPICEPETIEASDADEDSDDDDFDDDEIGDDED